MSQLSIFLSLFIMVVNSSSLRAAGGCYTSIFSFDFLPSCHGRCSDGRLIVDFIAQAAGLPLLPPYLGGEYQDFKKGVNFAVAGATALENSFFSERGISIPSTNNSLGVQLDWFKQLLPSLCSSVSECQDMLRNALFLMGEIGGNDYNIPLFQGRSLEEIRTFVPSVIIVISSAITAVIEMGARTLLVPGNFPIGCIPPYLDLYSSSSSEDYDEETGCIKWLNEFSVYHNQLLIKELDQLQKMHPHATVIYADYYEAAMTIFRSPEKYGFERPLMACCGGGGLYNHNSSCSCGELGSTVCEDPSQYISWDGLHLTEAAYKIIATELLQGGKYTSPPIISTCFLQGKISSI
ncbi:hypothetical protein J5N97_003591 [Dioscorea zingiberensis]|uniref:Uncharacterized protein n=1 Tax=Dioscorea zingiberensis TaxID=325984 RepID=A0A9D5D4E5_9LILI|nr:hypothetical protein J5N97_003591 [Dioscorea zingiberensis]